MANKKHISMKDKDKFMRIMRLTIGLIIGYLSPALMATEQVPPSPVETFKVAQREVIHGTISTGELRANRSVLIKSEIPGHIAKLYLPEGQIVEKGTVLIELDNAGAKANLEQVKARYEHSKLKYDRLLTLAQKGTGATSEKDEAYANLKHDQASVEASQAQLDKTILFAPFSGILGLRQVDIGDYIEPGQALINLDDINTLLVDFRVPEKYLTQLKVGQTIQITSEALPGQTFLGKIYAIAPQIDTITRTIQARAQLTNQNNVLRPGLFTKIKVVFETNPHALVVPEQSVFMLQNKHYVYRIVDNKAIQTEVATGVREDGMVEILRGLKPDDIIAKSGHMRLFDGASVTVVKP